MRYLTFILMFCWSVVKSQTYSDKVVESLTRLNSGEPAKARYMIDQLASIDQKQLWDELREEPAAKAFWVNLYNATVQLLLTEDPSRFNDRDAFFKKDWIVIAGEALSLDDIEHGIIRNSRHKYTLGYTQKLFVGDFEEKFRLGAVDYRVHFALNCGAKSCPPVGIYTATKVDEQLNKSTQLYLGKEVIFQSKENVIRVPKLCLWFNGDFGGEDGIRQMLTRFGFEKAMQKNPKIEYLEYDWTLLTGNYIEL